MANGWTLERRQRQSEAIRTWRPWESSTGPRTPEGKAKVAQNSYKGAERIVLRRLARVLNRNQEVLDELLTQDSGSIADRLVNAALNGNIRAVQEIGRAIDELLESAEAD